MRRRIVAGNWKMNLSFSEALNLAQLLNEAQKPEDGDMIIFPPSVYLFSIKEKFADLKVGMQNFYFVNEGAFTGEVSLSQAKSVGADWVLIGHSERRTLFNESNLMIKQKVDASVRENIPFIFCCGEPLNIRKTGREKDFVETQLNESLFHLNAEQLRNCVIAYEPIWAIGTGETATATQAEEMHAAIRSWVESNYGNEVADDIRILYGGSCNPSNADELFKCKNVDGGLIGGASLDANMFLAILNA